MTGFADPAAASYDRPDERVDVSIVITCFNEQKYLPVLLDSIRAQVTDLVGEVIVVDDASTDASVTIATAAGARVLASGDRGNVPAMRNLGLAQARGTSVLFADADVAFSDDYLEQMAGPILAGRADATLCLRHAVLESRFPVQPDSHSKSYAWFLRTLPWWCFMKIPIRVLPWLAAWARHTLRHGSLRSPLAIPDRVNTPAIAVRTDIARAIGGWSGAFGTHEDTLFCQDVFRRTDRVLWRARPVLYISARRNFPINARWIPRFLLSPVLDLLGLGGLGEGKIQDERGYKDPSGRR
jgi:glycosyltransferase involved in cell wall biosynthesis